MHYLFRAVSIINKFNEIIGKSVSWLIVLMILATFWEVVSRYILESPTAWAFEFSYLIHGAFFMLLGAYTLAKKEHVNVDIIYSKIAIRKRAILDIITAPLFFIFMFVMFWHGGIFAIESISYRETLSSAWAPPVYPFKLLIPIASLMLILQGLAKLVCDIYLIITGKESLK